MVQSLAHKRWAPLLLTGCWIAVAIFLVFYGILSYHNRLASDDIYVLNRLIEHGWWNAIVGFEFNSRVMSHGLFHSFFIVNSDLRTLHYQLFVFQWLQLFGVVAALRFFIEQFLLNEASHRLRKHESWLLASVTGIGLFFFTFQLNEVWFWMIASVIHLVPFIFLFTGFGLILKNSGKISGFIAIFLCFLFIGGTSETIAVSALMILGLWFIQVHKLKFITITYRKKAILTAAAGTLVFLSMNLIGSGTKNRVVLESAQEELQGSSMMDQLMEPKNIVFMVCVGVLFSLGAVFRSTGLLLSKHIGGKQWLFGAVILLAITIATFGPLYFVFGNLGPARAWTPFGFGLGIIILSASFYLGNRYYNSLAFYTTPIAIMGCIGLLVFYTIRQEKMVSEYSKAYDQRTDYLLQMTNSEENPVEVDRLPESGMLIHSTLEPDSSGWHNRQLVKAMKLPFGIVERP